MHTAQSVNNIAPVDPNTLVKQLLDGFDPETRPIDRRILLEATGIRLDPNDFKEVSDSKMTQPAIEIASPDIS